MLEHAPHGVGQVGQGLEPGRHALDAIRSEKQPVQEPFARACSASGLHILGVRGKNLACAGPELLGHGAHRRYALGIGGAAERQARRLGRLRKLGNVAWDILDVVGHGTPLRIVLVNSY